MILLSNIVHLGHHLRYGSFKVSQHVAVRQRHGWTACMPACLPVLLHCPSPHSCWPRQQGILYVESASQKEHLLYFLSRLSTLSQNKNSFQITS